MSRSNVFSLTELAERNHRAFVERESRRARLYLAGVPIIELAIEEPAPQPDGTRAWGDWSALTHKPPAPTGAGLTQTLDLSGKALGCPAVDALFAAARKRKGTR